MNDNFTKQNSNRILVIQVILKYNLYKFETLTVVVQELSVLLKDGFLYTTLTTLLNGYRCCLKTNTLAVCELANNLSVVAN